MKKRKICAVGLFCAVALSALAPEAVAVTVARPDSTGGLIRPSSTLNVEASPERSASYFEGVVEDFAVDNQGRTVWLMRQKDAAADASYIRVAVDENTKFDFEDNVANGNVLGIEYTDAGPREEKWVIKGLGVEKKSTANTKYTGLIKPKTTQTEVTVEYPHDASYDVLASKVTKKEAVSPEVVVSGKIIRLLPGGQNSDGGFELEPFFTPPVASDGTVADIAVQNIIFHYGSETKFSDTKPASSLKVGDQVTVTYSGILTRSLPPQGYAELVSDFQAPASK